ncbi:argG, partial [Symbiodinium sp. CCMP2456]
MAEIAASQALIAQRRLKFRFMMHDAWENALFVHWPVPPEVVANLLPRGLEPDVLEGSAWVGLVLLTERGVSAAHPLGRAIVRPIDHLGANV